MSKGKIIAIVICAIVGLGVAIGGISAIVSNSSSGSSSNTGYYDNGINEGADDGDATDEVAYDYTVIEKLLVDESFDRVGAVIAFRGVDGKIFYADDSYEPTAVMAFNPETNILENLYSVKHVNSMEKVNFINIFNSGFGQTILDIESWKYEDISVTDFNGDSKNVEPAMVIEYDGTNYYYIYTSTDEGGNDSELAIYSFTGDVDESEVIWSQPITGEWANVNDVFKCGNNLYAIIATDEAFSIYDITNDEEVVSTPMSDYGGLSQYICDDMFYYSDGDALYKATPSATGTKTEKVCNLACNSLVLVYGERAYYVEYADYDGTADLGYVDITTGEKSVLKNDYYPMDGI